jgi:hypothetical protein
MVLVTSLLTKMYKDVQECFATENPDFIAPRVTLLGAFSALHFTARSEHSEWLETIMG